MSSEYHRLVLIFADGIGLAPTGSHNPLSRMSSRSLGQLLGGPLTLEQCQQGDSLLLAALDARLGVEGLPQSATGQTALFTGVNGAARLGRHVTGLPGPRLRADIEDSNLFGQARQRGWRTTFANAYTPAYLRALRTAERRPSVTTCAVLAAGLRPRGVDRLRAGEAVSWDIVRDRFGDHVAEALPLVSPRQAGRHLARLAQQHQLTVFETFITDLAGHGRLGFTADEALSRVGGLLEGLLDSRGPRATILLTSDHGNLEDSLHRRHTLNPVPLLAVGPLAACFAGLESILEVTPRILECLDRPS